MKILDAQDDKIGICNFTKKTNMPEVSRFYGIIIAFYYNEHNPPLFHL